MNSEHPLTHQWHFQAIQGSWPSQWAIVVHCPDHLGLGGQTMPASVLGSWVSTQQLVPENVSPSWCTSKQFLAGSGELLPLGILGVAAVEGIWKSDVTAHSHTESVAGSSKVGHAWGTPGWSVSNVAHLALVSLWWALMPLLLLPAPAV